jgi:hypothetical protein
MLYALTPARYMQTTDEYILISHTQNHGVLNPIFPCTNNFQYSGEIDERLYIVETDWRINSMLVFPSANT